MRDLIAIEMSTGNMMRVLNSAILSGELTADVQAIATTTNSQVTLLAAQVNTNAEEISRVLADCRTFVQQTREESLAAKLQPTQEVDALQTKFQDIVKFVEGVPDTVSSLDSMLEAILTWLSANQLTDVAGNLSVLQATHDSLQENVDRRLRELTTDLASTRATAGADFGDFGGPPAQGQKDRNVFDP